MLKVEYSMMVDCSVDQVWRFMSDIEKAAKAIDKDVTEIKQTSEGPVGVGSTFRTKSTYLGTPRVADLHVSEWEPNKKMILVGEFGPIKRLSFTFAFEPIEGKTRLTRVAEAEVHGILRLVQPILVWRANSDVRRAMAHLKQLLETQAQA